MLHLVRLLVLVAASTYYLGSAADAVLRQCDLLGKVLLEHETELSLLAQLRDLRRQVSAECLVVDPGERLALGHQRVLGIERRAGDLDARVGDGEHTPAHLEADVLLAVRRDRAGERDLAREGTTLEGDRGDRAGGSRAGVAAAVTYLGAPATEEGVSLQAMLTFAPLGAYILLVPVRLLMSIGIDQCDELCHKLMLGVPMLVMCIAGALAGALTDETLGPPTMPMTGPLSITF